MRIYSKTKPLKIRLFEPTFDKEEKKVIVNVLQSGYWASGAGRNKVLEFEEQFKKYIGCKECVAVNSGTAALHLSLLQLDLKNKEVLVPSITFVSTIHAIIYAGARPLFVDVDEETLCIDINDIEKKISKKSRLILPVHLGGVSCDMTKMHKIANDSRINIIEDAAHACGAKYKGKKIGNHSEMVCFSFHPVKNLSMPTGGAIAINAVINKRKKILNSQRWCGIDNRKGVFYDVPRLGWNYYMNEFAAAIGLIQLKKLEKLNKRRKTIAKIYHNKINVEHKMPFIENSSYHLYWIRVKNRAQFIKQMNRKGIEVGIHYKPTHMMKLYNSKIPLPVTEKVWPEIVSIPMHANLSDEQVDYIIEQVNQSDSI